MLKHKWVLTTFGAAILGLIVGASGEAWGTANNTNYLTFSGPVALPGVSLPGGTYIFELAESASSRDIVVVRSRDRSKLYFMGFTTMVSRPHDLPFDSRVTFGESLQGTPPRITAWYPEGASTGHRFLYHDRGR
jgi:hypothetical protein